MERLQFFCNKIKQYSFIYYSFYIFSFVLSSCSTANLNDLDESLKDIQKAVNLVLPGGARTVSSNQRTYESRYFVPYVKDPDFDHASSAIKRAYANITILGNQRPYTVKIKVIIENKVQMEEMISTRYEFDKEDASIAKDLARKIKDTLVKRREHNNLFDDFRAF